MIARMGLLVLGITVLQAGAAAAQPDAPPASDAPGAATPPAYGRGHGGGGGWNTPQTLAEFQARYRERLMRADTDGDGRISLAEWTAAHPPRDGGEGPRGDPAAQFQRLDTNHDGYLEPAEIDAMSAERFARMDANHDGVLTPDERRAMWRGGGRGGEGGPPQ
jgi:hypothetical protein